MFGYDEITRQYHERYKLPIMHTETNLQEGPAGDEAVQWLWEQCPMSCGRGTQERPMVGFTWYSPKDQVD